MDSVILGHNIHCARRDEGLSSDKLSELCNITPAYLRQVEAGSKTPSLPLFVTLCNELSISPTYLLYGVVEKTVDTSIDDLDTLCKNAAPSQLKLISVMLNAAMKVINDGYPE